MLAVFSYPAFGVQTQSNQLLGQSQATSKGPNSGQWIDLVEALFAAVDRTSGSVNSIVP